MMQPRIPSLVPVLHVQSKSKRKRKRKQTATEVALSDLKSPQRRANNLHTHPTLNTQHMTPYIAPRAQQGMTAEELIASMRSTELEGMPPDIQLYEGRPTLAEDSVRSSYEEHRKVVLRAKALNENLFRAWWPPAQDNALALGINLTGNNSKIISAILFGHSVILCSDSDSEPHFSHLVEIISAITMEREYWISEARISKPVPHALIITNNRQTSDSFFDLLSHLIFEKHLLDVHVHMLTRRKDANGVRLPARIDILVTTLINLESFVQASNHIDWRFLKYLVIDTDWVDQTAALHNIESLFHPVTGQLRSFVQDCLTIAYTPKLSRPICSAILKKAIWTKTVAIIDLRTVSQHDQQSNALPSTRRVAEAQSIGKVSGKLNQPIKEEDHVEEPSQELNRISS
ncbi:hypothetical protein AOQ84DRAFT_384115 [Glonium stellatum]|uniref:Uncharacterized protein n=1 Tax=Glonium stellatum TaxID=574774 RepID=A0A8E2FE63_9PEZI|nr:hypothetical protein AOQ84DRAFT_384115 [Glonium stellatum]